METVQEVIEALVSKKPVKKDWWFDGDYLKFNKEGRLIRRSKGHSPDDCTVWIYQILADMLSDPSPWIMGTQEIK